MSVAPTATTLVGLAAGADALWSSSALATTLFAGFSTGVSATMLRRCLPLPPARSSAVTKRFRWP